MTATSLVPQGGLLLVLSRVTFVAALLSLGGVLVFRVVVLPRVAARTDAVALVDVERALRRLSRSALSLAAMGLAAWTILQSAQLAGAADIGQAVAALDLVLLGTQFGHLVLVQGGMLGLMALLSRRPTPMSAAIAASGCVALQAAHGHGMAMGGLAGPLVWVAAAHLLAVAAWIGGLLPLLLVVRLAPPRAAALAARWFSPLGKWCVAVLAGSALIQGSALVGSVPALFETAYGQVVLVKAGCFGLLFGLAVLNRYTLAPGLTQKGAAQARNRLIGSIALQTGAGLLAVVAAGVLSGLMPGMNMGRGK